MAISNDEMRRLVGVGWRYPFRFSTKNGGVSKAGNTDKSDSIEKIRQSLAQILSTYVGERVIRRGFGNELEDLLFESNSSYFRSRIISFIRDGMLQFEPRVIPNNISIINSDLASGSVDIEVSFVVIQTQQQGNVVFPFYVNNDSEAF